MKKLSIITFLFLALSSANAQDAFKHLSLGIEVSTIGVGIELATPLVADHLVLKAGYNFIPSFDFKVASTSMESLNKEISEINATAAKYNLQNSIKTRFDNLIMSANAKSSNAKLLLEYYPFTKSSFHIVAGAYLGFGDSLLDCNVLTDKLSYTNYTNINKEIDAIINEIKSIYDTVPEEFKEYLGNNISNLQNPFKDFPSFDVAGRYFQPKAQNGRLGLNAKIKAAQIRPYLGLGFGRSIPKTHFSFQFELGAWYHGKLGISSNDEIKTASSNTINLGVDKKTYDYFNDAVLYPQVSLKLIWKIL